MDSLPALCRLLRDYFFSRTDIVAARRSWIDRKTGEHITQPRPVKGDEQLDALIAFHVSGPDISKAPPLSYVNRQTGGLVADKRGFDRLGSYAVAPDNTTRWLCIDFDGAPHTLPLADPRAALLACLEQCRALEIPAHIEKSGSGAGWHLWVFFQEPVPAADARLLAHFIAPTGQVLATGEPADIRTGRGIECFPKQNTVSDKRIGAGNMVWLPFWYGAKDGGNQFHRVADDGSLTAYAPEGFERLSVSRLASALSQVPDDIRRFVLKTRQSKPTAKTRPPTSSRNFSPADCDLVHAALDHIPPDCPYDDWLRIGMALHQWDPQAGLAIWDAWSAHGEKYVSGEPEEKWSGFTSGGGVTLGTLFDMARKNGWQPPAYERTPLPTDEEIERFMDVDPETLIDQVKPGKKRDVLGCLIEAGKPLAPREIAERLGREQNATRVLLHRMVRDGQLEKDENDHYMPTSNVMADAPETITSDSECNAGNPETITSDPGCNDPTAPNVTADHYIGAKSNAGCNAPITFQSNGGDAPRLPTIVVNNRQLRHVIDEAWGALHAANFPPEFFQRKGDLVHLVRSSESPRITPTTITALFGHLSRVANWVVESNDMQRSVNPPKDVAAVMVEIPHADLPHIEDVVFTPVFTEDGRLVQAPGYHREARLWMHHPKGHVPMEIPARPTARQIDSARSLLLDDLLLDFPFATESDRAHAVAALLLPFVRRMINGPTPMHLIESPSPGTGKSLLAKVISKIALDKKEAETIPLARDEGENAKKITSILSHAPQIIILDNIPVGIRSAMLANVLTTTEWSDRLLGSTRMITLPNRALWLATANNPSLTLEIARRCVRIRIDSRHDRPWLLTEFKHTPLEDWVDEHRPRLIAALLTIIRGWIAAGRKPDNLSFGSFDGWARTIGGILRFAGIPGFLGHLEELYEAADAEGNEWREFTAAWWDRFGPQHVAAAELLDLATERELLATTIGDGNPQSQKIRIGRALSAMRDRQFDVFRITAQRNKTTKNQTYGLVNTTMDPAPAKVVDLFSERAGGSGELKQPTGNPPGNKAQQNQYASVNSVNPVSSSNYACTRACTHAHAARPANSPALTDPPGTTRTPDDDLVADLSGFGPEQEEEK